MLKVALLLVVAAAASSKFCPDKLHAIYADIHDGDKKEITISGTSMTIKPSGNNQTWVVKAEVDSNSCSASINFNVPRKPNPPPVSILLSLWYSVSTKGKKTVFEFTDPSGTLAAKESDPKTYPLNHWVEEVKKEDDISFTCPDKLQAVYADMLDGDKKEITISGTAITIKPSGNNQTWVRNSVMDSKTCSASIDFNNPGTPPGSLQATLVYIISATTKKTEFEITDPSGTLAAPSEPLNHWVEISKKISGSVTPLFAASHQAARGCIEAPNECTGPDSTECCPGSFCAEYIPYGQGIGYICAKHPAKKFLV